MKDVFLPWYNAYRFFVQNAKRLEVEGLAVFSLIDQASLLKSSNVLDHWINSATESLVSFVQQEMDAYRLYTVECLMFFLISVPLKDLCGCNLLGFVHCRLCHIW